MSAHTPPPTLESLTGRIDSLLALSVARRVRPPQCCSRPNAAFRVLGLARQIVMRAPDRRSVALTHVLVAPALLGLIDLSCLSWHGPCICSDVEHLAMLDTLKPQPLAGALP